MNQTEPIISVIIVNWKVRKLLEKCLQAVISETKDYSREIFVVDNDSRDSTSEMVMSEFPEVTMIALPSNHGFARANNLALRQARGKYLFLLNPDTEVQPGFFQRIIEHLDRHPEIKALAPKILNKDLTIQPSVRRFPNLLSQIMVLLKLSNIWPNHRLLRYYLATDFDYTRTQLIEQMMGAAMVWRRELLAEVGYFDAKFFIWFEEVDWCQRAQAKGVAIEYYPEASLVHYGGASFGQQKKFWKQLVFDWSLLYYFIKHQGVIKSIIILLFIPLNLFLTLGYIFWTNRNREFDLDIL